MVDVDVVIAKYNREEMARAREFCEAILGLEEDPRWHEDIIYHGRAHVDDLLPLADRPGVRVYANDLPPHRAYLLAESQLKITKGRPGLVIRIKPFPFPRVWDDWEVEALAALVLGRVWGQGACEVEADNYRLEVALVGTSLLPVIEEGGVEGLVERVVAAVREALALCGKARVRKVY